MNKFKLCYVDLPWCYFTTRELSDQWGDDWNDRPYEHNAGRPYTPSRPDLPDRSEKYPEDWNTDGTPRWEIKKVSIDGVWLEEPFEGHYSSPYSVEDINKGEVPWLMSPKYLKDNIKIMAGCTIDDFKKIINDNGGNVYGL